MSITILEDVNSYRLWKTFFDNNGNLIEHFVSLDYLTSVLISRKHMLYKIADNGQIEYSEVKNLIK